MRRRPAGTLSIWCFAGLYGPLAGKSLGVIYFLVIVTGFEFELP
jgi:hypothetical protein